MHSIHWYDEYIGKPWRAVPDPPESYTCGELCRHILQTRCGLNVPQILVDARDHRERVSGMKDPSRYALVPLPENCPPQEYDIVYFQRGLFQRHVGIAINTVEGVKIMHCVEGSGVITDTPGELLGTGTTKLHWYRHSALEGLCHK